MVRSVATVVAGDISRFVLMKFVNAGLLCKSAPSTSCGVLRAEKSGELAVYYIHWRRNELRYWRIGMYRRAAERVVAESHARGDLHTVAAA